MITAFIFLIIGFLVFTFTIVPALICLFFGIPITKKLDRANLLVKNSPIVKKYWTSISILGITFLFVSGLVYIFCPSAALNGYIIGSIFSFFISIGKVGKNNNNMQDYIRIQGRYFNKPEEDVMSFLNNSK